MTTEDWSDCDDLFDPETGRLHTSVPLDAIWRPLKIDLKGALLSFRWDRPEIDYIKPPSGLLDEFLELRTEVDFLNFARRLGPLGLSSEVEDAVPSPLPFGGLPRRERLESLEAWRRYQWEFSALLRISVAVRRKGTVDRQVFEEFQKHGVIGAAPTAPFLRAFDLRQPWPSILENWPAWSDRQRRGQAAILMMQRIREWVRACGIGPALVVDPERSPGSFDLVFQDRAAIPSVGAGLSLFGALTVQMLAASTGSALAICSACGRAFVPKRRQPAYGRRRYCRNCGRRAATRDAKADWRARKREEKKLEEPGPEKPRRPKRK